MSCIASGSGEEKGRGMVTASGYCYNPEAAATSGSSIQTHIQQGFDHHSSSEMYNNLTSGTMDIIGFNNKNHFFNQHEDVVTPTESTTAAAWQEHNRLLVEHPALRCVFPCEGNEKPSQGLSLSLCSSNPSTIGFQSFELRHQPDNDIGFLASSSRSSNTNTPGFFTKQINSLHHQQQQIIQDGFLGKASNVHHYYHQGQQQFLIRNSKYLGPAQELLTEFCNLGTNQNDHSSKIKLQKSNESLQEEDATGGSSSKNKSLCSLDLLELQKRKTRLFQMLEEVDRRYKHYCEQMKGVTSTFEAMAGSGASKVYSTLASKAMSRHFRCLRDAIVGQIKATKKAMGEKDTSAAPGASRGETPRLRILDQTLRQQRAFQQMSMMESHPWRPQRGLPERSVSVLRAWLFEHFLHPYPSDVDKHILARQTGLSRSQVSNWFINARVRLWKPMVEEMYLEELKEKEEDNNNNNNEEEQEGDNDRPPENNQNQDQKPSHDQLLRIDNECLSSIVNNNSEKRNEDKNGNRIQQQQEQLHNHVFSRSSGDSLSGMELDFSSYASAATNTRASHRQSYVEAAGGGGVSLTLGLQQHGGVSLAFSPVIASHHHHHHQGSLFHIEDCQQVQYSSLLENEAQNLPYRNLMGAQLLHDLAG